MAHPQTTPYTPYQVPSGAVKRPKAQAAPAWMLEEKMAGPAFYMILFVAVCKDIFDIFRAMVVAATLPIFIGFSLMVFFMTIASLLSVVIYLYLFLNGVGIFQKKVWKIVLAIAHPIIEVLPFISVLPLTVLHLITLKISVHREYKAKKELAATT